MFISQWIHMNELNRDRELCIWLPEDYAVSGKRYPVMYINDGQNAFFDDQAYAGVSWGFPEYVQRTGLELIMVAIPCNYEPWMREAEYGPWHTGRAITIHETGEPGPGLGGEGEQYVRFLMNELKPFMDSHFPTDPDDTAIVGSSAGGNIAMYAALKYPRVFSKCAALSCAFWYYPEQYAELAQAADLRPLKALYFDHGTDEGNGNDFVSKLYTYDNEMIHNILMSKDGSSKVHFCIYPGARHCEPEWRKRVPIFMELFY